MWPSAKDADAKVSDLLDLKPTAESTTIFVRNLSFDIDDKQLGSYFDCGPVKKAFLLRHKDTDASKGVGIVEFAFAQDAQLAVQRYHGKDWMGRPLHVEFALQNSSDPVQRQKEKQSHLGKLKKEQEQKQREERKAQKQAAQKEFDEEKKRREEEKAKTYIRQKSDSTTTTTTTSDDKGTTTAKSKGDKKDDKKDKKKDNKQDETLGCVLLIAHLDTAVEKDELMNKCKKFGQILNFVFPSPESTPATKTRPEALAARITFDTYQNANAALTSLATRSFGPNRCKGKLKILSAGASSKIARLIVRNLPFTMDQAGLRKLFEPHGKLTEVHIPLSESNKSRGFGFVQYEKYDDAEKAIEALNGFKPDGKRPITVDITLPKAKFDFQSKVLEAHQVFKAETMKDESSSDSDDDSDDDEEIDESLLKSKRSGNDIVQLGKDNVKTEIKKESKNEMKAETLSDDESDYDENDVADSQLIYTATGDSDAEIDADEDDEDEDNEEEDDDEDEDNEDENDHNFDENGVKIKTAAVKVKRPSDVTQGLTIFLRNLSYDTTEDSLYNKFSTFGRIMMVKICRDKVLNRSLGTAFIKFYDKAVVDTLLTNFAGEKLDKKEAHRRKKAFTSLLNESSIRLDGRDLILSLAVEKNEATRLRAENELKIGDKRNLYLAKEGVILPDTAAAEGVSKADMEKRTRGWQEKKQKLRNPNFSVSKTRLSIRNIPFALTDKELRQLVLLKTKEQLKKDGKQIGSVALKQVRIERDAQKFDKDGLPKSRGYGFIEFRDPDHSLTCLRVLNNNPTIWQNHSRPIVEFAIEDARKLLIHRKRLESKTTKGAKADTVKSSAESEALAFLKSGQQGTFTTTSLTQQQRDQNTKKIVEIFKTKGKSAEPIDERAKKRGRSGPTRKNETKKGRR